MTCFSTTDQSSVVLQQMFTTMKFTDIAFKAGKEGKIIRAHKNVLAASLEYFDLMFSGSFKESSDKEVVMGEVEADILEAVIKFLYLGLVLIPDLKTAICLWEAAHLMEISALQEHALKYMMDNISSDNCLELFLLAEQYELGDLSLKAGNFAVRDFEEVIEGNPFKQLSKGEIVNYINKLKGTTDENEIARAIFLWIEVDESRQKLHFKELLRLLDIGMIDQQELIDKLYLNCIDMDDSKYMLSSLHKMHVGNTKNLLEPNPEILLLVDALDNDRKALFFYNVAKDTFVGKCFLQINGKVEGVWQSKLIIIQSDLTKRKVITYDLQRKETEIIGSYDIEEYNSCKIINGDLWIPSHKFYIKINLQNGESKTVNTDGFNIDRFVQFDDRVYFIVFKWPRGQDYCIATYQENDNTWTKVKSFNNSVTKSLGWAVVHNSCIYFFGETKLTIYNPKENTCTEGMKYDILRFCRCVSIQNKLLVRKGNNTIWEYIDGELKYISSKLNILQGKVLEFFTLDS